MLRSTTNTQRVLLAISSCSLACFALLIYYVVPPLPRSIIPTNEFLGAVFSPDGSFLALVEGHAWESRRIRIVDVERKTSCFEVRNADSAPDEIAFSPDGSRFAAYVRDCLVKVWDFWSGQELCSIPVSCDWEGGRPTPRFSADSRHLLLGDSTTLHVSKYVFWNIESGARESEIPVANLEFVDGGKMAIGWPAQDGPLQAGQVGVKFWDVSNPSVPVLLYERTLENEFSFAISRDGHYDLATFEGPCRGRSSSSTS